MNSCRACHPEMSPERFTMTSEAPFCASQQIHCSLVVCDSEWVTIAVHSTFLNIHRSGILYSPVWLLHDWCHVKLLPSRRTFCDPTNHAPVYNVTYSEAIVCLFFCLFVFLPHYGGTNTEIRISTKSRHEKIVSPAATAGNRTRKLSITHQAFYHWDVPALLGDSCTSRLFPWTDPWEIDDEDKKRLLKELAFSDLTNKIIFVRECLLF